MRLLRDIDMRVVAIDVVEDRLDFAQSLGAVPFLGDATEQEILKRAQVERARALVAAADTDAVNTYIVLTARTVTPGIPIVARAASDEAVSRLNAAGANRVISPYQIAGRRMAVAATDREVLDFIDTPGRVGAHETHRLVAQIRIGEGAGRSIGDLFSNADVQLIATVQADDDVTFSPPADTMVAEVDRLVVYGDESAIHRFAEQHHQ